jgi:uncharacterized membrane protein YeaQ/YmgE (transglycosylase-associated protein family)
MLDVIAWIIFGLIAGAIAKAILPGADPGGAIVTILIGIAGALLGGFLGRAILGYGTVTETGAGITRPGFLMNLVLAVIGAIILLACYRLIRGRSMTS